MRCPFELRGPVARRDQDRDLGQLLGKPGAEADMRAELVGVVGQTRALQPDMHRRRHRAARPCLARIPDAALRIVELAFVYLLVARHVGLPGSHSIRPNHTVRSATSRRTIWSGAGWAGWRSRRSGSAAR